MASSAVAGILRSVGGTVSFNVLQSRSRSDARLDGLPSSEASCSGDPLVDILLSQEFPLSVQKTQTFGADTPVFNRNSYVAKRYKAYRVFQTVGNVSGRVGKLRVANLEPQLTKTWLIENESPNDDCRLASTNVAQECDDDCSRRGVVCGEELAISSTDRRGDRHLPSAGITSDVVAFLKHRRQHGLDIDSYLCIEILKRCSMQKDLIATRQVHNYIIQSGMQNNRYVATTLLNAYIKCGSLPDARRVFDGLEKSDRTVITWTVMIGAYAKSSCGGEAYRLFIQMRQEGFTPNAITYLSILNASASAGALEWVKEVHSHALKAGLESDMRVGNALMHIYAKCGSIDDSRSVFDRMEKRHVITWNVMIAAYAERGCGVEAYRLFLQMKRDGIIPDAFTFTSILNASANVRALEWVKEVHRHALKAGLESDLHVGTALMRIYAKCGSIGDSRLVFDRMEKRDVITWTVMIGGLAEHGCGHEALEVFGKMNAVCVKPDGTTFGAVLSACSHAGLVDDGNWLFSAMTQDYGIECSVVHYNCMVDLLGRAGHLEEAKLLIDDMPLEPDAVTWGALLGACRTYGNVQLGELAAKELLKLEPNDTSAYVLLSNIYAAAGKLEKVSSVRTMMEQRGVRKGPGRSWIEVDKKIHEFVVGDTSHPEAKAIYTMLNKLTEKLKAEGYIPDTELVLQNIHEEDKELALCSHSEKLAIAYGLLRIPRGKPIRVYKNLRVCSDCHRATKLISKVTGREIIARDANRFHHFKDGVCSCDDYW